jgi:hypothetical protein
MVSAALPFPHAEGSLALGAVGVALAGIVVAQRGIPRAVLVGLVLGYIAFGFTFTVHIATHSYYSLPLIPVLALCIGTFAGFVLTRLRVQSPQAHLAIAAIVGLAIGVSAFKSHAVVSGSSATREQQIADYRRIGEVTRHTTRALVVDERLISPISYWGWIVGRYWYLPTPDEDLPHSDDRSLPGVDRADFDFLIVTAMTELGTEPRLRGLARELPIVERTSRYAVFDLRGGRAVDAARMSEAQS